MLMLDQVIFKATTINSESSSKNKVKAGQTIQLAEKQTIDVDKDTEKKDQVSLEKDSEDKPAGPDDQTKLNSDGSSAENNKTDEQRVNTITLVTFGIAIMLHSTIDGLAIGVFKQASEMLVLATSVIIHKIPVACTVGTTFKSNGQPLKKCSTIIVFILFILSSPTGMLIGMILGETSSNMGIVFIQAFSGGTFIYLACCDLLIHEFHNEHLDGNDKLSNFGKFMMMIFGSAIVVTLIAMAPAHAH